MSDEKRGKPAPAVGQRWENPLCNSKYNPHTIVELRSITVDDGTVPGVLMRTANGETREWPIEGRDASGAMIFWRCLDGGPTPTPGEGNGMEAGPDGFPLRCLGCDGDKTGNTFYCDICIVDQGTAEQRVKGREEWRRGARDFPRSPAPSQEAMKCGRKGMLWRDGRWRPCPGCSECPRPARPAAEFINCTFDRIGQIPVRVDPSLKPGEWRLESPPFVVPVDFRHGVGIDIGCEPAKPAPVYGRMVGEMRDASGAPLSALGRVQAKKEPEPYVCPVDDWDLLPDAGR